MPKKRGKSGRFENAIARQIVSIKVLPEIAEPLSKIPNRSKYIEAVLMERIASSLPPDPDWGYFEEWEQILDLITLAGSALIRLKENEERGTAGDNAIAVLEKDVEKWLEGLRQREAI